MPFRLWDQLRDWVLLLTLLLVSVIVMLAQNEPMLRGLRALSLDMSSWMEGHFAWVGYFFQALDENEELREENILIASELARSREARLENERLRSLLGFADTTSLSLVPARIVSKDFHLEENYMTIDAGRLDSVQVGMAVVDERGILGKVVFVSDRYSRVMTYLNTEFRAPAKVQPFQTAGLLRWPGNRSGVLLLEYVVKTEPVKKGQLVVTSGYSSVFPPGYPIGRVDSVASLAGRNDLLILVQPTAPIHTAEHAFVVLMRPDPEIDALEEQTIQSAR